MAMTAGKTQDFYNASRRQWNPWITPRTNQMHNGSPSPWPASPMLLVVTQLEEPSSEAIHAPQSTAVLPARLMPHPRAHDRKAHRFTRREREAAPAKLERNLALPRA